MAAPKRLCIFHIYMLAHHRCPRRRRREPAQSPGACAMRRAKTDVRATIDAAKSQKRREVEEHEHRLAAEAQEQALATRIGDLCEDFLADAGAGMIPNVFDRVAIGFAALQDAFVEETKQALCARGGGGGAPARSSWPRPRPLPERDAPRAARAEPHRGAAGAGADEAAAPHRQAAQYTRHGGSNPVAAE